MKREIKFKIENNNKISQLCTDVKVDYQDFSLFCKSDIGGCSLVSDSGLELEFDVNSKQIGGIGGYIGVLPKPQLLDIQIHPNNKSCVLVIDDNEEYWSGIGYTFKFNPAVKYDKEKSILLFGEYSQENEIYQLLENAFVQLDEKMQLKSVIITDIELKKENSFEK